MTTSDTGFVLDASVVLKWYLRDEENLAEADRLQAEAETGQVNLTAPNYIRYEVANGLEIARRQQRLADETLTRSLFNFLALPVYQERDSDALLALALDLARRHAIAPYDALYLALAEAMGFAFVTADRRLYRRIVDDVPYARWIGDVSLP